MKKIAILALVTPLAACSGDGIGGFVGSDITESASTGLTAVLGLKSPEQKNEEIVLYSRSPLVLPPNYNLRPPENQEQLQANLGEHWPDDPDERARQLAREEALSRTKVDPKEFKEAISEAGRSKPLTPEELRAGTISPDQVNRNQDYDPRDSAASEALSPRELLNRHRQTGEKQVNQTVQGEGPFGSTQETVVVEEEPEKKGFFSRVFGG